MSPLEELYAVFARLDIVLACTTTAEQLQEVRDFLGRVTQASAAEFDLRRAYAAAVAEAGESLGEGVATWREWPDQRGTAAKRARCARLPRPRHSCEPPI
jgi:hypothetical protein